MRGESRGQRGSAAERGHAPLAAESEGRAGVLQEARARAGGVTGIESFDEAGFAGGLLEVNFCRAGGLAEGGDAGGAAARVQLRGGLRGAAEAHPAVEGVAGEIGDEVNVALGAGLCLKRGDRRLG